MASPGYHDDGKQAGGHSRVVYMSPPASFPGRRAAAEARMRNSGSLTGLLLPLAIFLFLALVSVNCALWWRVTRVQRETAELYDLLPQGGAGRGSLGRVLEPASHDAPQVYMTIYDLRSLSLQSTHRL